MTERENSPDFTNTSYPELLSRQYPVFVILVSQKDKPKSCELLPRAVSCLGELIASQTDREHVEEEVLDMCNLGQGVYEKGKRAGELQGIEQGIEQGHTESEQRISRLKHLMMEADRTEEFLAALDDPRRCTGCTGNSASSLIEADAGRMSMEVSTKIRKHLWAAAVFCAVLLGGCRADMSFSQQQMPSVDMPDGLVQGLQHAASRNDADSAQDTAPVQQEQPAPDPDTVPAVSEQSSDVQLQEVMHPVSRCVQETGWYCGPAVMQMLLSHYGIAASQPDLARQLHTSQVTGTEYADMARVASVQVFGREPGNDGEPGFRAWTGTENAMTPQDQEQFLARANRDLTTGDVLSAAVDVGTLYPELNIRGAHVVLINGARQDKNGHICQLRLEDPSYLVDYGTEEEHWVDADRFLNAMNRCPEPGYIW